MGGFEWREMRDVARLYVTLVTRSELSRQGVGWVRDDA